MTVISLGARIDGDGTSFAVFSVAEGVELCMFDEESRETRRALEADEGYVWRAHVDGVGHGARYGFRVHGAWATGAGVRCNPAKLLLDPYARAVAGTVSWDASRRGDDPGDSAAHVPRSVVCGREFDWGEDRPPGTRLEDSIIYELHVEGFTKLHPHVPERLRGTYPGLAEPAPIDHLTRLGVTAVELLPVHQFSFTTVRWSPGGCATTGAISRSTSSRPTTSTRRVVIAAARSTSSRRWSSLCTPRDSR